MKKNIALSACLLLAGLAATAACLHARTDPRLMVLHVFVTLADNQHQGIVPVPARLGERTIPDTLRDADLVAYVGRDGLMDFQVSPVAGTKKRTET